MTPLADHSVAWTDEKARALLRRMFDAAVDAADPRKVLAPHLPAPPQGRCVVVGAGKAAATMAMAVEAAWPDVELTGTVVAPYGYGGSTDRINVREASHPVPDASSEAAAREILGAVAGLSPQDLVLSLISGGGSSVLALPVEGLTLTDKQQVNRALLASGLDIRTMNAIRRRLSAIKGGKLAAAAAPAQVITLAISDIPGDDVAAIASGPTIPDPDAGRDLTPFADLLHDHISRAAYDRLVRPSGPAKEVPEVDVRLIATPRGCLEAAAQVAHDAGVEVKFLGDDLEGESRDLGTEMAKLALAPVEQPTLFLSGGETTVTLTGCTPGRGGRNTEFTLSLAIALGGKEGIWALAADTDGEDGASGGGAGAVMAPDTLARAKSAGLDAVQHLERHDSGTFFDGIGDLLKTGPTLTNVNDFRAILVVPKR
ncbi:glycerate kinase [Novosphingobium flavum]|uniref:Glycerate kinase n=1 Tax=Novosphingobium flavum TaxID=1778672 RepID=A0A7X1FUY3_9SPHN|nr:glycerate kinase [Novosphingobium flavum]MBC2667446.1 glycerate kinase [Novosphingobium flavum]